MHGAGQRARHLLSTTVVGLVYSGGGFSYWHWSVPSSLVSTKNRWDKEMQLTSNVNKPSVLVQPALTKHHGLEDSKQHNCIFHSSGG